MPNKTRSELMAENLSLRARLAAVEAQLAQRPRGEGPPSATHPTERQRVAEALKASEVRYRRLFETAKDGILILDAETGHITDSNPFVEQMLGYSHAELMGRRLWEIGPFKDIAASRISFQELQSREYIRYEDLPLETKAGGQRQVEFVSNLYLVDHTKVIQCNIRDITERKLVESQVQHANARLTSLVTALERRDSEMTLLNRMNDLLQTCETQEEAYRVVALIAAELFVGHAGCLAVSSGRPTRPSMPPSREGGTASLSSRCGTESHPCAERLRSKVSTTSRRRPLTAAGRTTSAPADPRHEFGRNTLPRARASRRWRGHPRRPRRIHGPVATASARRDDPRRSAPRASPACQRPILRGRRGWRRSRDSAAAR